MASVTAGAKMRLITTGQPAVADTPHTNGPTTVPDLPGYKDLIKDTKITSQVKEINGFSYTVQYQPAGALTNPELTDEVLAACLESLGSVLPSTGIHNLHTLQTTVQRPNEKTVRLETNKAIVSVSLPEVRNHFSLNVYDDRMSIRRESSSFVDFYRWYCRFMPEAKAIEATIRRAIELKLNKTLAIVQTQYEFTINFSDFEPTGRRTLPARNVDILETIIPVIPDSRGLTRLSEQNFYRLDLTMSRLEEFYLGTTRKRRNCWYILEAPFNEKGRFLVLKAQLRNSSLELIDEAFEGDGPAIAPFDSDYATDYYIAINGFLKGRALETFMGRMLENWTFKTQRQL